MQNIIENIKLTRQWLLESIKELTPQQLNHIPSGFNNNIIWNLAHLISAQQGLCYARAGQPLIIDEYLFTNYKTGSKPEANVEGAEIEKIKSLMISTLLKLEEDYHNNIFNNYAPFKTRYQVEIKNIDEAISFIQFHEGLHIGAIAALKKLVA
ncbi:MAG: DinB family protein [Bacteroidetes bacterium]|nr:DinB family protein [Bacteroidota bacterium]MBS1757551.1 DinB family protein [Bacteroidota bacterium]